MIKIFNKTTGKYVEDDDIDICIGSDGRIYEVSAASGFGGSVWLDREDVSEYYEIRLISEVL